MQLNDFTDADLIQAHEAGDEAALVVYYTALADAAEASGNVDATCFYLTHAYVFALHSGDAKAPTLHARLVEHGREQ